MLGIGVLRKEGKDTTNTNKKTKVLNQQYASVFTAGNANSTQSIGNR